MSDLAAERIARERTRLRGKSADELRALIRPQTELAGAVFETITSQAARMELEERR